MDSGSVTNSANPVLPNTTESPQPQLTIQPSRYESQKHRDFDSFLNYLKSKTHKTLSLSLPDCTGAHVIEYLNYLDRVGRTKVHVTGCTYFGNPDPLAECGCPHKQAWGSLDALIGHLRAAFEENGGSRELNPFGESAVRGYLKEVRECQAKARGVDFKKKKKKRVVESSNVTDAAMSLMSFSGQATGCGVGQGTFGSVASAETNGGGIKGRLV